MKTKTKTSFLGFVVPTVDFNNRDLQSTKKCKMFHRMIDWKILTENMQNSEDPKCIFFFRHTSKTTAASRKKPVQFLRKGVFKQITREWRENRLGLMHLL